MWGHIGKVMVEQCGGRWNNNSNCRTVSLNSGTVMVERKSGTVWWKSEGGTV